MSVDQVDKIDLATIDKASGDMWLTISDHLPWDGAHLTMLQDRLNTYLRFIESGEMLRAFPEAKGRKAVINLVVKYSVSDEASRFLQLASGEIERAGYRLQFSLLRPN